LKKLLVKFAGLEPA